MTRFDLIAAFTRADRAVAALWAELADRWADEPGEPERRLISNLGQHLIASLQLGRTERFSAVFQVVEACMAHGDSDARHAIRSILLADLQNLGLHVSTRPRQFEPWLGELSKGAWSRLGRGRQTKKHLADLSIDRDWLESSGGFAAL